jgi:mono/diheme cytochrome c family protein
VLTDSDGLPVNRPRPRCAASVCLSGDRLPLPTEVERSRPRMNNLQMMTSFRSTLHTSMVLLACLHISFFTAKALVAYASNGDARERGAVDFHTKGCERCHSISGIGGDRAPDLESVGSRRKADQIKAQILNGGHGMPPFRGVLTRNEVNDLVSFLASCRADKVPGCRQWMPAQSAQ